MRPRQPCRPCPRFRGRNPADKRLAADIARIVDGGTQSHVAAEGQGASAAAEPPANARGEPERACAPRRVSWPPMPLTDVRRYSGASRTSGRILAAPVEGT